MARRSLRNFFCVGFALSACLAFSEGNAEPKGLQFVEIAGTRVQVEVVRTREAWSRGLMFREHLGEKEGMFFWGSQERMQSFWMKNTLIPLDVVFISKDLRILNIQKGEPLSEAALPSDGPALHVLEVKSGSAAKWKWKKGDRLRLIGIR